MVAPNAFIAVYIMASRRNGTIYTGVTSELIQRVWQHRTGAIGGFTRHYGCTRLVWFERHERIETAIAREKAIKHWVRDWKVKLIEDFNPTWRDLWDDIQPGVEAGQNQNGPLS